MYFAVYLQSKPETVHQRIKNRKLNGEEDIPLVRIHFINSNDFFLKLNLGTFSDLKYLSLTAVILVE